MSNNGYYSYPAISGKNLVFISEGDIWHCHLSNLLARRLTSNRGTIKTPIFSADGKYLAFSSTMEGHSDLYVMPSSAGKITRLTYLNDDINVIAWNKEGIYFSSSYNQPFMKHNLIWRINPDGGVPEVLNIGPANYISFSNNDTGMVIQRHGYREYGYWKRYRGGTAGEIWLTKKKDSFFKLIDLKADLSRPMWLESNIIVFGSDHDGIGNLYSTDADGKKLQKLTNHKDFYVRNQCSDGKNIVYQAGSDIWFLDKTKNIKLNIIYNSDRPGRSRKFFNTERFLQGCSLHPQGKKIALVSRGKAAVCHNWDGAVAQIGDSQGIRYRLPSWLNDGKRLLLVNDRSGEESLAIYNVDTAVIESKSKEKNFDIGRVINIWVNPKKDSAVLFNHRSDILYIDLKKWTIHKIDNSAYHSPSGGDWSADGNWFTYSLSCSRKKMSIKLFNAKTKISHTITDPVLVDENPVFDPDGKFIYFISHRTFDPQMDNLHFEYGFNYSAKIYAIPLEKNTLSPFLINPETAESSQDKNNDDSKKEKHEKNKEVCEVKIDLDNIKKRLFEFPIRVGDYFNLKAIKGKLLFLSRSEEDSSDSMEPENLGNNLELFDFKTLKIETLSSDVQDFDLSEDMESTIARCGKKLRIIKTGEKFNNEQGCNAKSGWIDLNRVKFFVNPVDEWHQMYKEAWRLQRDHYWVEDMSKIDWQVVFDRYYKLLERVSTREEFSDLIWEMQGELGTSHAYVMGGDNKKAVNWSVGNLGADFKWNKKTKAYEITNIVNGDCWDNTASSALINTGMDVSKGNHLVAIDKQELKNDLTPHEVLFNKAGEIVEIEVADSNLKNKRTFITKLTTNLYKARYREWVESNRSYIFNKTKGKAGYIHIPDMSSGGFAEFYRGFLQELDKPGLVIDIRFNGGGHVSQLLLEKLAHKRLGYDKTRWHGISPYPDESPVGPMVTLTNEYTGSDGDIFSHAFKMMRLGKLIGKRTWGGVIGICPRYGLVDGGITTQPEFSFYFDDVKWDVENYGVDPDIEVEIKPQDYIKNIDPQIEMGIKELMQLIDRQELKGVDMDNRPNLSLPLNIK